MRYLNQDEIPELEGEYPGAPQLQLQLLEHELAEHGMHDTSEHGMHFDGGLLIEDDLDVLVTARPKRRHFLPPFDMI